MAVCLLDCPICEGFLIDGHSRIGGSHPSHLHLISASQGPCAVNFFPITGASFLRSFSSHPSPLVSFYDHSIENGRLSLATL